MGTKYKFLVLFFFLKDKYKEIKFNLSRLLNLKGLYRVSMHIVFRVVCVTKRKHVIDLDEELN